MSALSSPAECSPEKDEARRSLWMECVRGFAKGRLGIEGLDDPHNASTIRWAVGLAALAIAIRVFFCAYSGRVWEDALITVQHSENCAMGLGLTHHPTEPRVHGFTSPLSVLVPLPGDLVHVGFGISFIRIVSVFCAALTILYAMAIAIHPRIALPTPLAVMLMGFLAVEHHQIFFGASGMETQMVVMILLMSIYYLIARKPTHLGISLGLCMLARPDFGFWTLIVGTYLLMTDRRALPRVVTSALAVYGPWLVFTTLYYGSPLPNTLIAKALGYEPWWSRLGLTYLEFKRTFVDKLVYEVFAQLGPTHLGHALYKGSFFWDKRVISNAVLALAVLGALAALLRKQWWLLPVALFVFAYGLYYALLVPVLFQWYMPPLEAATLLLSACGLQAAVSWLAYPRLRTALWSVTAAVYLAFIVSILPTTFRAEKAIQETIENGVRKQIGLYLARVMRPDETLGCEPLGYVGYYARRTVYDYPGMGSRKVTDFLLTHPGQRTMNGLFNHLRPDYLLLRPWEYEAIKKAENGSWIDQDYHIDRTFDVPDDAPQWLQEDYAAHFILLKKNPGNSGKES